MKTNRDISFNDKKQLVTKTKLNSKSSSANDEANETSPLKVESVPSS
jgi:hypothetical protein